MAGKDLLTARLKFLNQSAHFMTTLSPAVAAHIKSSCDSLYAEEFDMQLPNKELLARKKDACHACGSPFVPGLSCQVIHESIRPRKTTPKDSKHKVSKSGSSTITSRRVVYSCNQCSRRTILPIGTSPPPTVLRKAKKLSQKEQVVSEPAPLSPVPTKPTEPPKPAPPSTNASSKKRAKARKGGLQAMLAKSKTESAAASQQGFGLDLMDLMQSG